MGINNLKISAEDVRLRLFKYRNEKRGKTTVITARHYQFLDKVLEGLTIEEIAEELKLKRCSVIQLFHTVKQRLMPYIFEDRLVATLLAAGLHDNKMWKTKEPQEKTE